MPLHVNTNNCEIQTTDKQMPNNVYTKLVNTQKKEINYDKGRDIEQSAGYFKGWKTKYD